MENNNSEHECERSSVPYQNSADVLYAYSSYNDGTSMPPVALLVVHTACLLDHTKNMYPACKHLHECSDASHAHVGRVECDAYLGCSDSVAVASL